MFDRTKDSLLFDLRRIRRNILDEFMVRSDNLGFELNKLVDSESKLVRKAAERGQDVLQNIRKSVWEFYKVRYDQQDLADFLWRGISAAGHLRPDGRTGFAESMAKAAGKAYKEYGIKTTFYQENLEDLDLHRNPSKYVDFFYGQMDKVSEGGEEG